MQVAIDNYQILLDVCIKGFLLEVDVQNSVYSKVIIDTSPGTKGTNKLGSPGFSQQKVNTNRIMSPSSQCNIAVFHRKYAADENPNLHKTH
jgi:hypothetical protein